jgi:hypothetical protein
MRSTNLIEAQAGSISDRIRPMWGCLHGLECRMAKEAVPVDDELYLLTRTAYEAGHHLTVKLHYLGCRGTGQRKIQLLVNLEF